MVELDQESSQGQAMTEKISAPQIRLVNKKPERCPDCGCEKIYRNGHYVIKAEAIKSALRLPDPKQGVRVQMYVCANCGKYLKSGEIEVRVL